MPDDALERIEREMTLLVRRTLKARAGIPGDRSQSLSRSAYSILARLQDCGPTRLTTIAERFDLDVSTVSRQVQALMQAGLVQRATDPDDRRAMLLTLTARGQEVVAANRTWRHQRLVEVLAPWSEEDRDVFGRLLERFNAGMSNPPAQPGEPPTTTTTRTTQGAL